jgi:hypothetical protein
MKFKFNPFTGNFSPYSSGSSSGGNYIPYGTPIAPLVINETLGITANANQRQIIFTKSNGGEKTVSKNPQISNGTIIGQELMLVGTSDLDYLILNHGNGLSINGAIELKNDCYILLIWNGSLWCETSRVY